MLLPQGIFIFVIVSLLCSCMGFYRFVWFMSVGYGVAAAGIGATMFILALLRGQASVVFLLQCVVFVVYGIRLGGFLFWRELKNASYRAKLKEVGGDATVPVFVAAIMWVCCAVLYVMQSSGPVYRLLNGLAAAPGAAAVIGLVISILGVALEAAADKQKSEQKVTAPNMPAMQGLYRLCRCPNYFGEMLFWLGAFVSGFGSYAGLQWIPALIGIVAIEGIMVSGAKRVETRHIKHYGSYPEYNAYADKTPLLIPFVPLYHMTNPEKIAREEAAKKAKAAAKAAKKG